MKRHADLCRLLLLAAASEGHLGYHLEIMREAGLIDDEGITDKGLGVLEPIREDTVYETLRKKVSPPELLLNAAVSTFFDRRS